MYKICVSRKGISSLQLAKELDRPWYMLQRIKEACGNKYKVLAGIVEADEKYVGGKETNKHESKKLKKGRGTVGKQPILGLKERDGEFMATPIETVDATTIHRMFHSHVRPGSAVHTDEHAAYIGLDGLFYRHESVNLSAKEYVRGNVHTNSIESRCGPSWSAPSWAVHHHVSKKHLGRYLAEVCYRLNEGNVKIHVRDRVGMLCAMCAGVTLPWKKLTED